MSTVVATESSRAGVDCDVIVIGAGVTGLYCIHRMRELGLKVRAFEEGTGVGGTWYWSRYPGCRLDSESFTYGYSFSPELLRDWRWSEMYATQAEIEAYFNFAADRLGLREFIQFETRIERLEYIEAEQYWLVVPSKGAPVRARYVIAAVGLLSAHFVPDLEGVDEFEGEWRHTGRWPKEGIDLDGKRVGVIGTGSTGMQVVSAIAPIISHLTVFQRTANYMAPLRNRPIDDEMQRWIEEHYDEIFELCAASPTGFMHQFDPRSAMSVSKAERWTKFAELWREPGFKKWLSNFADVMVPGPANEEYSEFVRERMRERIKDPELAKILVPMDHPFGSKRPPCENGYLEVFAQDNVDLIDVKSDPIERMTRTGIRTRDKDIPLDVIIFATGYDAVTGSLLRMKITGAGGHEIADKYSAGPRNYLGVMTRDFPNFFMLNSASVGNLVRAAEPLVDWVADCITHMRDASLAAMQPTEEAENYWTQYTSDAGIRLLRTKANSWNVGANIPGKPAALVTPPDNAVVMRRRREKEAAEGYPGFSFAPQHAGSPAPEAATR